MTPSSSSSSLSSSPPPSSQPVVVDQPPPAITPAIAPEPEKEAPRPPPVETEPPPTIATPPEQAREEVVEPSREESTVRPASPRPIKRAVRDDASKAKPGILRVGSPVFAWVTVGKETKESGEKFYLPPGKYTVRVKHHQTGETKTYAVTVVSGEFTNLTAEWEDE